MKAKTCLFNLIALVSVSLYLGVTAGGAQDITAPSIDSPIVRADLERAKLIAGSNADLQQTLTLCLNPQTYHTWLSTMPNAKKVAQFKVFDQLYYLGMKDVGSWVLVTSDGIIQFDALDNAEEAERVIIGGYKKFGLDPHQMKYLIITHYHGDHSGGAKYLQDTYHPRVILSTADWDMLEKQPAKRPNGTLFPVPPKRDMDAIDGQKLTLGGTSVTFWITPGHTPGPISSVFSVTDHGQMHTVSFLGGTAFPQTLDALTQSRSSLERFTAISEDAHTDVVLSNHSWFDNTYEDNGTDKMSELAKRGPGQPNPFVVGENEMVRYMMVSLACEQAAEDRLKENIATK
jgi:metallo-beta-lactamase class B